MSASLLSLFLTRARPSLERKVISYTRAFSFSPGDAGQKAEELAQQQQQQCMSHTDQPSLSTVAAHAGVTTTTRYTNQALAPPIELATTYTRPAQGTYEPSHAVYSRMDNPTRRLLEQTVWQLETNTTSTIICNSDNSTTCMTYAFASGMMAASSIVLAHQLPLTVILPLDLYHGVSTVMVDVFQEKWGVKVRRVDLTDPKLLQQELLQLTQEQHDIDTTHNILIWIETPSNPSCHVMDIPAICQIVQKVRKQQQQQTNITTVVDSTLAPPVIQQPLLLCQNGNNHHHPDNAGIDLVMHSATKYMAGHSDATVGIVTASPFTQQGRMLGPKLQQTQIAVGGVASPMDSWLTLRGLRTLHVRVQRQSQTAMTLATRLQELKQQQQQQQQDKNSIMIIQKVHYPGLISHPQHAVAKRQMKQQQYGGVLSVEFASPHLAMAFAGALNIMYRATSLGGTETLVEERRSIEPPGRQTSPPGLVRISVGLEAETDLLRDVERALDIAKQVCHENCDS
ncbi:Cystathionine gamma-lyase [Seminavis robusta]|uniref:cystathionine gamma-lyase n=1 Tax=Seminavis robusta TaxID=568900 RepID=A0A9N8EBS4_9STRA|nr:Cystathionine gamma-lyase [Seminavis robusta]|eukprot:Sro861_g212230.1 Cystathionine gamma-lyase (511) ;mRNA; r:15757-17289